MAFVKRLDASVIVDRKDIVVVDPSGKVNATKRGQSQDKYESDWSRGCVGEFAVARYLTSLGHIVDTTHQSRGQNLHSADITVNGKPIQVKTESLGSWVFERSSAGSTGWVVLCGHVPPYFELGDVEIKWLVRHSVCERLWKPLRKPELVTKRAVYEEDLEELLREQSETHAL